MLFAHILGDAGYAGPKTTNAAHDEIDGNTRFACAVQRIDNARIDKRVQLGPDRGGPPSFGVGYFAFDGFDQPPIKRQRRERDLLETRRLGIAGDVVEELRGVAPKRGSAEKSESV